MAHPQPVHSPQVPIRLRAPCAIQEAVQELHEALAGGGGGATFIMDNGYCYGRSEEVLRAEAAVVAIGVGSRSCTSRRRWAKEAGSAGRSRRSRSRRRSLRTRRRAAVVGRGSRRCWSILLHFDAVGMMHFYALLMRCIYKHLVHLSVAAFGVHERDEGGNPGHRGHVLQDLRSPRLVVRIALRRSMRTTRKSGWTTRSRRSPW